MPSPDRAERAVMKNKKIIIPYPSALSPHARERGFTFVEMAILLVVIGLLVGLGAGIAGVLSRNLKYTESREIVDAAVESVISYAAGNDYLPAAFATFQSIVRNPKDAFLGDLIYVWDASLAGTGKTICGKKTSAITLTTATAGTVSNVAFIVLSKGDDYTTDTTCSGACTSGAYSGTVTESNNDIVKYVTLFELKAKIKCD